MIIIPAREIIIDGSYKDRVFIVDSKTNNIKVRELEPGKYLKFGENKIWCVNKAYLDKENEWNKIIIWNLEKIMTIRQWKLYIAEAYKWMHFQNPVSKPLNALLIAYAYTLEEVKGKPEPDAALMIKREGKIWEVITMRRINIYEAVEYIENFTIENILEIVGDTVR
jgi:hypothetical protein